MYLYYRLIYFATWPGRLRVDRAALLMGVKWCNTILFYDLLIRSQSAGLKVPGGSSSSSHAGRRVRHSEKDYYVQH